MSEKYYKVKNIDSNVKKVFEPKMIHHQLRTKNK